MKKYNGSVNAVIALPAASNRLATYVGREAKERRIVMSNERKKYIIDDLRLPSLKETQKPATI